VKSRASARAARASHALAIFLTLLVGACGLPQRERHPRKSPYFHDERGRPTEPLELVVATYNVHGLPWPVLKDRPEAMVRIAQQLLDVPAPNTPDVIAFQEVWTPWLRSTLTRALERGGYEHAHFYCSWPFGTGMLVVSRLPILETNLHTFDADAPWDRSGMDWWGAKGVGLARIEVEPGAVVDLYAAHLVANYGGKNSNDDARTAQGRELAQFLAATPEHLPCIVLGDINCGPGDAEFEPMVELGGLDSLDETGGLDHGFWRRSSAFDCELLEQVRLKNYVEQDGRSVILSDHACRIFRLRISPADSRSALPSVPNRE